MLSDHYINLRSISCILFGANVVLPKLFTKLTMYDSLYLIMKKIHIR